MELLGLSPRALLMASLLVGALLLALFLLKGEERRVRVPTLAFWQQAVAQKSAAASWTRLRRLLSLLLALTIAAALLLALADPQLALHEPQRHVVILIDHSLSMSARDVSPSRLARAKQLAGAIVRGLGPRDQALIAELGHTTTPSSRFTADAGLLRAAIDAIRPGDSDADLERAAQLVRGALNARSRPELWLVSDGNARGAAQAAEILRGLPGLELHYVKVGTSDRNVAITAFSVRPYRLDRARHEGLVTLENFGKHAELVRLSVTSDGAVISKRALTLEPGQRARHVLTDLSLASATLQASIELDNGPDLLLADDTAYAALPSSERIRIGLISSGNLYLEAALLLEEYLEVSTSGLPNAPFPDADVLVFDRLLPDRAPAQSALYLGPEPRAQAFSPLPMTGEVVRPYFDRADKTHPLIKGLALADVNIARARRTSPLPDDTVIAATAERIPLLVEGQREGRPFILLPFDLRESDLPLRPAFPLLLLNAIDRLAGAEPREAQLSRVDDTVTVAVDRAAQAVTLSSPDAQHTQLTAHDGFVRFVPHQRGIYTLSDGARASHVAVLLPADTEGAIAPRDSAIVRAEPLAQLDEAPFSPADRRPWPWLSGLAAVLLALEWVSFHRRWTI